MKFDISNVKARGILDSRGNPTIEVDIILNDGSIGRAAVPSGASTGMFEAIELRDHQSLFHGKGVTKAIKIIKDVIAPKIIGMDARNQEALDHLMIELDGTKNKSKLGGNSILGISLAVAKAAAISKQEWLYEHIKKDAALLPIPFFNVINGGEHAGNAAGLF